MLPVQLDESAKDYGLVYVFPMNNHYVLINSGLPWWTPKVPKIGERNNSTSFAFLSPVMNILSDYKDFILFKNTPDNIVSEGYFDNDWKLPADEAAKMKASGVIQLK